MRATKVISFGQFKAPPANGMERAVIGTEYVECKGIRVAVFKFPQASVAQVGNSVGG